ncbi:MAG: amino acid ABC transporter ATP-binding protein [Fusobacteriaceae bacterium]|nr:amino acid ABC transporter ATP-binding protein [Fusobacteriaceae bacterium]
MVKLNKIYKSFNKLEVLKGISLEVNQGEILTIIGPSGSGKSTLLRCINFLEVPEHGEVTLDNITIDTKHISKRDIRHLREKATMVFQNYNLFKHKTAIENVMEGLIVIKKMTKKEAYDIAIKYLEKVGLLDRIDYYPSQLSGGQQQRVGIARALAMNPKVILFDEPTSALDPELIGEVLEVIRNLAKEGITMIIVTHEIQFAKEIANRVIFMDNGAIIEDGSPKEVLENPTHERTKSFLKRIVEK